MTDCACYCHVNPGATCTIDDGSSGVPGKPYCGAHVEADYLPVCVMGDPYPRHVGLICRRHYHHIGARLDQIIELYATLPDVLVPAYSLGPSTTAQYAPGSEPGRLDVMAITDRRAHHAYQMCTCGRCGAADDPPIFDLLSVLGSWVRIVIEERGEDVMPAAVLPADEPRTLGPVCAFEPCWHLSCASVTGRRPPVGLTLSALVHVLKRERHWMAQQLWIDDYLAVLEDAHRAIARAAGESMWPKPIGKCPNCDAALFNTVGADLVTCTRCKTPWAGLSLVRLRLIHEQEAG